MCFQKGRYMEKAIATKPLTITRLLVLTVFSLLVQLFLFISIVTVLLTEFVLIKMAFFVAVGTSKDVLQWFQVPIVVWALFLFTSVITLLVFGKVFRIIFLRMQSKIAVTESDYSHVCVFGSLIQGVFCIALFTGHAGFGPAPIALTGPFWLMFFLSVQAYIKIRKNKQATA